MNTTKSLLTTVSLAAILFTGCSSEEAKKVKLDGSSTVAPITMVAAELFQKENPSVRVTVGISGTGGGFKKFLADEADLRTDINDASRPIRQKEIDRAEKLGVEFIEIPIAIDGIAIVANPANDWCEHLTVDELKKMWAPGSEVKNWKDVRTGFPDVPLKLYGPGTDSGTFDYFTEAIVGESKASREDFTMSEDDNVLVQGVNGDKGGLGYFGFSYYEANRDKLKLIGVDPGTGTPIKPSLDIIRGGTYKPLSRPLFLYINTASAKKSEVISFLEYFIKNAPKIVEHPMVNYVALTPDLYTAALKRVKDGVTGSAIAEAGGSGPVDLKALFAK